MSYIEKCALLTGGLEVSFSIFLIEVQWSQMLSEQGIPLSTLVGICSTASQTS